MKLFVIFVALLCIITLGETRNIKANKYSEEESNIVNIGLPFKPYRGKQEPTALFEYSGKTGRIETRFCPEGQFLNLARICVDRAEFFGPNPPMPKGVPAFYKEMGWTPGYIWEQIEKECLEGGRVFTRQKKCVEYEAPLPEIGCNPGRVYSHSKNKCVKRTKVEGPRTIPRREYY